MGSDNTEAVDLSSNQRQTRVIPVADMKPPHVGIEEDFQDWFHNVFVSEGRHPDLAADLIHVATSLTGGRGPPVAFPTETVYGLGADATSSAGVRSIYATKDRPSDNPLIVHIGCLPQLRALLQDEIPRIYEPLIYKFWPGPLTIILPLPNPSPFASEVTCGLSTFGVRLPSTPLARLFISLVGKPVAAPSANASTRPSPTTAQHVLHDLGGRIDFILDGGSCKVGVESTVIDGLSDPPAILRPGGIGIEEIRALGGSWTNVTIGYQDRQQNIAPVNGVSQGPRAPGMKYKHYSPKGRVVLFETGTSLAIVREKINQEALTPTPGNTNSIRIGIVSTLKWPEFADLPTTPRTIRMPLLHAHTPPVAFRQQYGERNGDLTSLYNIQLGKNTQEVAKNLFAALRTLDLLRCSIIFVEGISDMEGDLSAAVMNRLRKAAEVEIGGN